MAHEHAADAGDDRAHGGHDHDGHRDDDRGDHDDEHGASRHRDHAHEDGDGHDHDADRHDHAHGGRGHDQDDAHEEHGHGGHDHGHGHEREHQSGLAGFFSSLFHAHSHDGSDSLDDALAGSEEGIRTVKIGLVGLGATAILQLVVVILSGSVGLLADMIHNFADASTAVPLWLAFTLSRRKPNNQYTYGYGRAEDLAGVFVVLMIAGSAAVAAWESFQRLLHPQEIGYLWAVAAAALIGFIGNEFVAQYRIRTGERIGSAALVADGYHARTDGLTSLAVLIGAGGVWLGYPVADPLVGLLITLAILLILKDAVVQIWHRLMDAVDPELVEQARKAAAGAEGVEEVSGVRMRWIGHSIHAEANVIADQEMPLNRAHEVAERARHAMLHAVPKLNSVTVHVDPCAHDGHDPHADLAHHDQGRALDPDRASRRR